ncbi:histidine--tRNA ligase [Mycoplasma sp. P36-A1]|uniref:histidine--tRNA ligase n=1 Tax=Mycoplasma sp. P36-A1 TaxID=3252900 RepID=UPI003C2FC9B9
MEIIIKPRGTEDLLFEDTKKWQIIEKIIKDEASKYNFLEMRTPIFESTSLFQRGVGETTDVVSKEMYTFSDKKGRSLTLRPEGTTGVIRAYIENKMFGYDNQPVKAYYCGPMFRYERPQKGRQRQFHQFGVETLGEKSPQIDVECITLGLDVLNKFGLKNLKVLINSLGDTESRLAYRTALIEYFSQYKEELCSDCKDRLEKNPLRILDCKVCSKKEFMKKVPKFSDYLNEASTKYFNDVLTILDSLKIQYEIDERLVRGLDYYTDTIFEVVSTNESSGAQATLFGGGRYDGLVESLGGPATSGVGFGMGLERILIAIDTENPNLFKQEALDVYVMPLIPEAMNYSFKILETLRQKGVKADMAYEIKSMKAMFRYVERNNIDNVIIIGENEMNNQSIIYKDIKSNQQTQLDENWLSTILERINK